MLPRSGFCTSGADGVQTQYALLRNAGLHRGLGLGDDPPMAIQFARARYISRSSGGNAVRSAAYNGRDAIKGRDASLTRGLVISWPHHLSLSAGNRKPAIMAQSTPSQPRPHREEQPESTVGLVTVLHLLVTSSPVWIRGIVLLVITGAMLVVVTVVCIAIFSGREVTLWPPHIAAYEPPLVQNCRSIIAALPDLRKPEEQEVAQINKTIDVQLAQINKLYADATDFPPKYPVASTLAAEEKKPLSDLQQQLAGALQKLQGRADNVISACLAH